MAACFPQAGVRVPAWGEKKQAGCFSPAEALALTNPQTHTLASMLFRIKEVIWTFRLAPRSPPLETILPSSRL